MGVTWDTELWVVRAPDGRAVAVEGSAAVKIHRGAGEAPPREGQRVHIPGIPNCRLGLKIYSEISRWKH